MPEAPERTIAGTLNYTAGRTELHLHDAFRPLRGQIHAGDIETYPLIYGNTRDGAAMTLVDAQRIGRSFRFGSGGMREPVRLTTTLLLVGAHLPADFTYPEMRCRVPGLPMWLSTRIVEQSLPDQDQASGNFTINIRVLGLPEETMRVPIIGATIGCSIEIPFTSTSGFESAEIKPSGWLRITPDTPQRIEWYFEQFLKITTLLSFHAGTPMAPDCIQACIGEAHREVSVMVAWRNAKYCQYTNLHEFYMLRGAMEAELTEVVARWFEIYPKVAMPSQLALSVLASENLWLHVEFLSLMQALEGFHRGLFDGNYMDETAYDAVKKSLGDAIPPGLSPDHKDALRTRIKYGNQISLRKRLDALAELLSEPIRAMIFGNDGKVPRQWIDTRHYYTHWDEELRANVLDGQAMYHAIVRMRHFLRALYLDLVGIPQTAILNSLTNLCDSSQHLIQLNAAERRNAG